MKRYLVSLSCLTLLVACTDVNPALLIVQNQAINPDDCSIPGEETALSRSSGTLNLDGNVGYQFFPLIRNLAAELADESRNVVQINGADIVLTASNSVRSQEVFAPLAGDASRTQRFFRSITAGAAAPVSFLLIDQTQAGLLSVAGSEQVQILARTRVFGVINGDDTASDWIDYPVTVCAGTTCAVGASSCTPFQY